MWSPLETLGSWEGAIVYCYSVSRHGHSLACDQLFWSTSAEYSPACLLQSWLLTKQTSSELFINTGTVSLIRESIFSPHTTQRWRETEKENTELTADLCLCLLQAEMSQESPLHRGKQRAPPGFLNLGFKIRKELLSSESVSWERSDALSTPGRLWYSQNAVYQVGINRSHWLKLSQRCGWGKVTTSLQRCVEEIQPV